ncbi:MAG TPA: SDR family NAD(P)-dependent oxidoreductase [Puia sp.]|nr:SDR family NAD(P)-dependent oxidoreductase [Puia sp.]
MEKYFKGKTVLVTGAGWGIGAATALLFAGYGASVIVSDIDKKRGKAIVARIKERKGNAAYIRTDTSSAEACEKLVKSTIRKYGSIDIACNNAVLFMEPGHPVANGTEEYDQEMFRILDGTHNCMQYEIGAMLERGGGVIVNTSFIIGPIGFAALRQFINAKYAITANIGSGIGEYPSRGLHINTIAPAFINSALFQDIFQREKEGREGSSAIKPEMIKEVAALVLWLSSGEMHLLEPLVNRNN